MESRAESAIYCMLISDCWSTFATYICYTPSNYSYWIFSVPRPKKVCEIIWILTSIGRNFRGGSRLPDLWGAPISPNPLCFSIDWVYIVLSVFDQYQSKQVIKQHLLSISYLMFISLDLCSPDVVLCSRGRIMILKRRFVCTTNWRKHLP